VSSTPRALVENRTAFLGISTPLSSLTGKAAGRVNLGMRSLGDCTGCNDRVDEFIDVTVDVDCDAADKPKDVGGVVVGVLVPGLECLSEGREGGGGNGGTGGMARSSQFMLVLRA